MTQGLTRRALAAALAAPGCARAALAPQVPRGAAAKPSFFDDFSRPIDLFDPRSGRGRWKTNYWFGDQAAADSRSLPDERQIYVDPAYCGLNPFRQSPQGLAIVAAANRSPGDPRLFNPYTGRKTPLPYTSGLITTERSFSQRYGYFEARMALPQVRGCWPAFWLLGQPHGERSGDEIDILEWVASNPRRLFLTVHLGQKAQSKWVDGFATDRMVRYGLLWTRDRLQWLVDGREVHAIDNPGFHAPMYMLLNLAVGGWDANLPEDPAGFPAALRIASVKAHPLAG